MKCTLNPEWNEEFPPFDIMTGTFEQKKLAHKHNFSLTNKSKEQHEAEMIMSMTQKDELRLFFGFEPPRKDRAVAVPGARHNVQIYLGDTIRQFKSKLMLACQKEAEAEVKDASKKQQFKNVNLSFLHAVTVFVP